jgi:16S rRNA (guanine(1405)-N(7))-methyltransferase
VSEAGRREGAAAVAKAVAESRRYRAVDPAVVRRLADEELSRARSTDDAIKRVKRRLHQAVGAYRPGRQTGQEREIERLIAARREDPSGGELRSACRDLMAHHASTRERLPYLDRFYAGLWDSIGGAPASLLDLGCGLAPLALPWMGLSASAEYVAIDADAAAIALVEGFLSTVGQPHLTEVRDLAATFNPPPAEVALLLKLVPILDHQRPHAALRLIQGLTVDRVVLSFPVRSLGGRRRGMETTYRRRFDALLTALGRDAGDVREASIPNELVFVMKMRPSDGGVGA